MIRARRICVTAVAVLAALAGSPGLAQARQPTEAGPLSANADGGLPPGWRLGGEGAARELVWRAPKPVPMGDARVEFHAEGRLLGVPKAGKDGRTFRLDLGEAPSERLTDLQVLASGRRLDTAPADGPAQPRERESLAARQPPAALPAGGVDPGKPGSYRTVTGAYDLDPVKLPGFAAPVEMRAEVVAPRGATGSRPLALFLHGRHATCYKPGAEDDVTGDWPCPVGTKPIPSHKGYLRDQKLLASQGYVTVSISANGINGQDWTADDGGAQARSSLVRRHLARWADWSAHRATAPAVVREAPKADLSRVLLVGHSRGGEGVNRAAMDSLYPPPAAQDGYRGPVRWKVRGTVLIGPTIFGQNPVADVPSVTILPGCDGDVSDLQGEVYVDGTRGISGGTALHSAVYMVGANHNYFNSEWTPGQAEAPAGDDFWEDEEQPDPVCSAGTATRLTADQQHRAGATYVAAAARLFVGGDDRVRPLLDGSGRRAPSADPARVLTHAVGARRGAGFLPDGPVKVTGAKLCSAIDPDPAVACLDPEAAGSSPHFAWWETGRETGRRAVALKWSAPGTAARVSPAKPLSLAGSKDLALRVFVPPNTTGTKLDVSVTDAAGRRATLGRVQVDGLPGSNRTASYWAREVRVPLTAATRAGLDLRHVRALELTPRSQSGQAWLMDAWGWAPGTPAVKAAALPRVDVGRTLVKEGDSGTRTYRVPVEISGRGSGQVRVYVLDPDTDVVTDQLVTVRPGGNAIDVPVEVKGNTRFADDVRHDIVVKAVRNAVVGSHRGGVTAENDDPEPEITLTPVADRVTEGETLTWRMSLAEPADVEIWQPVRVLAVSEGAELSTKDVDPQWLLDHSGDSPDPERPLSDANLWVWMSIPAGSTSIDFTVKTVRDQLAEPTESMRLVPTDFDAEPLPDRPVLTGTVLDAS
ncbi:alpha/beta hydrolase family protein [Streptomyces sp. NPDC058676]|uniref:alpha/beta hydrolase family protein n=1 Tax=unclassified Streptomyces TaxID=2593676 RepID=UPI00365D54EB